MIDSILIATSNEGKAKEFKEILGNDWKVQTLLDLDSIPQIIEDGKTFEENALIKAFALSKKFEGYVVADDSGLEVDCLDGEPGIYSARYAGEHGNDEANNAKLLQALKDIPDDKKGAQFKCVLALVLQDRVLKTVEGVIRGKILDGPRGNNGFGYDPLFLPDGYERTTAEMSPEEKHQISHRGQAVKKLIHFLKDSGRLSLGGE